jgi:branched-chain amino acid transport system substrate-binding protein
MAGIENGKEAVSRREFLKLAGVAGAAVGLGAGLGGLVAACGGGETTTTTAGATSTTTAGATSTTAAASTTTVSAGPEAGREVKIGYVTPITGPIAAFGMADEFCVNLWSAAIGDGLVCGDGKKHPIKFEVLDSQSDSMRASQVAGDLIQNNKVDIIMAAASPDTVNPVADQAEAQSTPCLTCDCPMEPYYFGRGATPDTPFKWTYHAFWGLQQIQNVSLSLWDQYPTNKVVGAVWPNNTDGNAYRDSYPPFIEKNAYKLVDGGLYQEPNEDFTSIISNFKNAGAEIFTGLMIPPDFVNFWKQATQQGWKPKVFDLAKAILFPSAMEAVGEIGYNLSGPMFWHPSFPFKSTLSGMTCQQIADEWEKKNNTMWQQPILHYLLGEWVVDVLKRTKNVDDKEEIIANVASTKMAETVGGPLDFTAPVDMAGLHPVKNVVVTPLYGGQWVKGKGKYPFDIVIVSNPNKNAVTVQQKLIPLNP